MDGYKNSALVVAHPDDEIIWFNSVLDKVSKIYICYLNTPLDKTLKAKRLKVLKEHPLKDKIIAFDATDETIKSKLTEVLKLYHMIFTHNPWGEYGHKQHILIYNIVRELQSKYKFDLWISSFSPKRLELPTNPKMVKIRNLYIKHGAWTISKHSQLSTENFWQVPG